MKNKIPIKKDIDNSGDGGLYAELIRNRAFQSSQGYPASLAGWHPLITAANNTNITTSSTHLSLRSLDAPLSPALATSLNVAPASASAAGPVGFFNDGYWGMDVNVQEYRGSFWVRGEYTGDFVASLQSSSSSGNGSAGEIFGVAKVKSEARADEWVEHEFVLVPERDAPSSNNTFAITFDVEVSEAVAAAAANLMDTH